MLIRPRVSLSKNYPTSQDIILQQGTYNRYCKYAKSCERRQNVSLFVFVVLGGLLVVISRSIMRQCKMKRVLAPFSKAKGGKTDDVCRDSLITKQALACCPLILSSTS